MAMMPLATPRAVQRSVFVLAVSRMQHRVGFEGLLCPSPTGPTAQATPGITPVWTVNPPGSGTCVLAETQIERGGSCVWSSSPQAWIMR